MAKSSFKELQKTWYAKLKETGFKDIEKPEGEGVMPTDRYYPYAFDTLHSTQIAAVEDYYSMARQFLTEYVFASELDRLIWSEYSEGGSVRGIANWLAEKHKITRKKSTVSLDIKRLEAEMKKKYMNG